MMNKSEFVKQKAGFFFNLISAAAFLMVLSVVSQIMVMLFGEYLPLLGLVSALVFLVGSFVYASNKEFMALLDEQRGFYAKRD